MCTTNLQVLLALRPNGWVRETDFELRETPIPTPAPGELLVRNLYCAVGSWGLLGRSASEYGTLCHWDAGHECGDRAARGC
jgi:NADPH-dependent curcumin reductase CurA